MEEYRTDCERALHEVEVRMVEVVYKYGRSRCVDLMGMIMQMMEVEAYLVEYAQNITQEKWRESGLGDVDWGGWSERIDEACKNAKRQHLSRRDNSLHSQWRDLTESGRHCSVVEGLPNAEAFECGMWKEFVERYVGVSDIATYDGEMGKEALLKRFRLSAQPMNDMMVWMGERLEYWLLELEKKRTMGDVDPLRKELGGELQRVLRGWKEYRVGWTNEVWERLLWREAEEMKERECQEGLWQLLRADNKTKKYRRGLLKLAGLMKLMGVLLAEGAYTCDEGMLVRSIEKREDEGATFEAQLKKYMKRGFDENSYDEMKIDKWVREVCREMRK